MRVAIEAGEGVATGTVGAFLAEWLEVRSTSLRPASVRAYSTHLGYLIDQLGTVKQADLGPGHVAACQTALLARLSPTTVRGVTVTLRQALKAAVAWRRLSWNPAAEVTMPQVLPSPMHPWTAEELRAFLAAAEGDRFYPIFVLLVSTGMRRGEVLGLRWADVDLDAGRLAVRHTVGRVGGKVLAGSRRRRSRTGPSLSTQTPWQSCAATGSPSSKSGSPGVAGTATRTWSSHERTERRSTRSMWAGRCGASPGRPVSGRYGPMIFATAGRPPPSSRRPPEGGERPARP